MCCLGNNEGHKEHFVVDPFHCQRTAITKVKQEVHWGAIRTAKQSQVIHTTDKIQISYTFLSCVKMHGWVDR